MRFWTMRLWLLAALLFAGAAFAPPRAAAQSLDTYAHFYALNGQQLTVGTLTQPDGRRQLVVLSGSRIVHRLATRFTAHTSLSVPQYRSSGQAEWLEFSASDHRYNTAYRWFFRSGRLGYEAHDTRTGRTRRRLL